MMSTINIFHINLEQISFAYDAIIFSIGSNTVYDMILHTTMNGIGILWEENITQKNKSKTVGTT